MNVGLVLTGSIRLVRGQLRRPNERDLLCNERVSLHNAAAAAHTSSAQASLSPARTRQGRPRDRREDVKEACQKFGPESE